MIKEKISSQEIIDLIALKASVSKRAAEEFLKVMIASIEEALLAGEVVKIKNFGTFKLQWNEPRKSVNVQTREEIVIGGYYKVVFVPDSTLREQVNEPFAHLEPVELDATNKKNELIEEADIVSDPLRMFNEQAFEIKNLISEIQALSTNSKTKSLESKDEETTVIDDEKKDELYIIDDEKKDELHIIDVEKKDEILVTGDEKKDELNLIEDERLPEVPVIEYEIQDKVTIPEDQKTNEDKILKVENLVEISQEDKILSETQKEDHFKLQELESTKPENKEVFSKLSVDNKDEVNQIPPSNEENSLASDLPVTPYLSNITPTGKSKIWMYILISLAGIIVFGTGICMFYPPATEFSRNTLSNGQHTATEISGNISVSEMINTVSGWFTPAEKPVQIKRLVVIPKDTTDLDTLSQRKPIDSLQVLFDNPRVYKDYIASERIKVGSRLTIMSKRYYGHKDFWVYIYEANKDRISNPDDIAIGTLIRIPKLDSRLIDITNPRCLQKTKELHDIYIK